MANQSTLHFLKCSLCSVYNLLKYCGEEARAIFSVEGYTALIMQYHESSIPDIKSISCLILAYLVTDDQFGRYIKDDSIQFIVNNIENNFRHQKGPRRSFETSELCLALREMAKNDTSVSRILQCGGIQALGSVLAKGTSREKCAAALALLSLALHESPTATARVQIHSTLASDINAQLSALRSQMPVSISAEGRRGAIEDMVEDYRSFKSWILERGNLLPEVKAISPVDRRIKTALWMQSIFQRLQWEIHVDDELHDRQRMGKVEEKERAHVMLSYSYVQKNIAHKIARAVSESGYRIWLDTEHMHTEPDIMDAIAIAVKRAFAVCVLYSEAYKRCPNTRMEAQYAQKLDKPMIFCRVEQGYLPDGWLGVLTARRTCIDFSEKFAFEDASSELLHRLASIKMSVRDNKAEIYDKTLVTQQTNEISLWDMEKVNEWFMNQGLPIVYRENISGKDLLFLKKMQSSAPESFFRFLSETWKIASVPVMRSFAEALEKL
ncbi:conserved hypothetical protein [Echinococcus multilocularis]|uniref:TIR domain-containing protein n=1 Tax=Echinococcus multilocularis TaxID=6211 RepID=A0A068Y065_ECHMU|nr:conserved hypothetical protein [Echinococcus multilocularis]